MSECCYRKCGLNAVKCFNVLGAEFWYCDEHYSWVRGFFSANVTRVRVESVVVHDRKLVYDRKWRADHREQVLASSKEWFSNHPDYHREYYSRVKSKSSPAVVA